MATYQAYKGTRDFYPDNKRRFDHFVNIWRQTSESYGYEPWAAPLLEPLDIYQIKNQSSPEIIQRQIYSFVDSGDRQIAIRPELTPSLARLVVQKQTNLHYPLRWSSVGRVWRYEQPQRGRFREHWQFNADILGVEAPTAEFELILLLVDFFKNLGAGSSSYRVHINSRSLMNFILKNYFRLNLTQVETAINLIDRRAKNRDLFKAQIEQLLTRDQRQAGLLADIEKFLGLTDLTKLPPAIHADSSWQQLKKLLDDLRSARIMNVKFDPQIVRGFDYYTGIVFEVFDQSPTNQRSLAGGGRYDNLIESFGGQPLPAAGFGLGEATLFNFCQDHSLLPNLGAQIDAMVVLIDPVDYVAAHEPITALRAEGLKIVVEVSARKIGKKIGLAAKQAAAYVVFIGPDELKKGSFKLKHLSSGKEQTLSLPRLISAISATKD